MISKVLTFSVLLIFASNLSGQTLLKNIEDLAPGSGSSPRNWSAATDERFIFQAMNTLQSNFLFSSDGTEAGTIGLGGYLVDTDIIRLGNQAYFGGCFIGFSADSCGSLYVSDGTETGTGFFFDLDPGGVNLGIEDIVAGDSLFYFSGHTINEGFELWRSNGTAAGTYRILDLEAGMASGYVGGLSVIDDIAYFAGFTSQHGVEPWRSDGTAAGTYMITDLNEGTGNGQPAGFTASGGYIYFSGLGTNTGQEVWRTTGAQGNIELIGELGGSTDSSWPEQFVDADGRLYYAAVGVGSAGHDLFVYDHVGDPVHIDFITGDIFPRALMAFGEGEVIFTANTSTAGRELWRSDGTQAGTHMITDLYPGEKDGVFPTGTPELSFYVWNDSLIYFAGADSVHAANEFVYELFVSDGTEAGTQLVSDQFPGTEGTNPGYFFEFDNRLYFAATDPVVGSEPFYLDFGSTTAISPEQISMAQLPYPNPLPDGMPLNTVINLKEATEIYAQLFDISGHAVQEIQHLGYYPAGANHLQLELDDQLHGLYFLILKGKDSQINMKVMLE